jgi:hypothetical protein
MWYFCKYKDILGKPGEGLHSYRILDISITDVLFTILLAKFIQYNLLESYSIWLILIFCFLAGIIIHRIFSVETTIDRLFFA